jgi:hypothetical protein
VRERVRAARGGGAREGGRARRARGQRGRVARGGEGGREREMRRGSREGAAAQKSVLPYRNGSKLSGMGNSRQSRLRRWPKLAADAQRLDSVLFRVQVSSSVARNASIT